MSDRLAGKTALVTAPLPSLNPRWISNNLWVRDDQAVL
jgi:hypothetical protein